MNVAFRAECASDYQSCGWRVGFPVGLPMWCTIVRVGVRTLNRVHKGSTFCLRLERKTPCLALN